jgi:hypothetical protein
MDNIYIVTAHANSRSKSSNFKYIVEPKLVRIHPIPFFAKRKIEKLNHWRITDKKVNRLAMATFLRAFSNDGIFGPAWAW